MWELVCWQLVVTTKIAGPACWVVRTQGCAFCDIHVMCVQGTAAQRQSAWEVATALGLIVHQEPHLLQAYVATLSVTSCD